MFIELAKNESYRGKSYEAGEVIEVGDALGERLILNGHKKTIAPTNEPLTDEQVEELDYKQARALIKKFEVETEDRNFITYKAALKVYFAEQRD